MRDRVFLEILVIAGLLATTTLTAQTPPVAVPRPFPGAGTSAPATGRGSSAPAPSPAAPQPAAPSTPPPAAAPTQAPLLPTTVPLYPSAEFLDAFDAGSGQQYYLYGTNLSYAEIVAFYRTALKAGGREIYKTPGMYQFDLGRFQEDTMVYPPSVVVKDYATPNSPGYLFVSGTTEKRYRTIIQIVPPGPTR